MPREQSELSFLSFNEAKPKLLEWQSALTGFESPQHVQEDLKEALNNIQMMLDLGEEEFSSADFLELEESVDYIIREMQRSHRERK